MEGEFRTKGKTDGGQDLSLFDAPEISPEEHTAHIAGIIANALEATQLVVVKEIKANLVNQVHLLCRVKDQNARAVAHKLGKALLRKARDDSSIEIFIGKQFLLKNDDMKYAWVFSFGSEDLKHLVNVIVETIEAAVPKKKVEVLESPLMGPGTPQSPGRGTRGAFGTKG